MTFIAGLLAVFAIWWQIRTSNKQLKTQIEAERNVRDEEHRQQRKALIRAYRLEIERVTDFVAKNVVPSVHGFGDPGFNAPKAIPTLESCCFAVLRGNSGFLGEFSPESVEAIIDFYFHAEACFAAAQAYPWLVQEEVTRERILPTTGAAYRTLNEIQRMAAIMEEVAKKATTSLAKEDKT